MSLEGVSDQYPAGTLQYASFWKRAFAGFLDIILLLLVVSPLLGKIIAPPPYLQDLVNQHNGGLINDEDFTNRVMDYMINRGGIHTMTVDSIYQFIIIAVITILFWHYKAGTPGKMLLSLRIVDAKTLGNLSLKQQIIRYLGYIVSTLPFCLGFVWIALNRKRQAWHDIMAGTVVIEDKKIKNA